MEEIIENIAKDKGVAFKKETTSWFNGHGYFPLHSYRINYQFHGWEVTLNGEWRVSEFVRSEKNAGNPYSSVYLWSFKAVKYSVERKLVFEISKSSWFGKRFGMKSFDVESNVPALKQSLVGMRALEDWYLDKHPLDNIFDCQTKENTTTISTSVNTEFSVYEKVIRAITLIEELCMKVDDLG